ncbi:MAG: hypothetical protein KOO63_05670 [Bacteroidales bacterium]|nr:hypothetical protein [Candidatus Latescibacterota bacterium]
MNLKAMDSAFKRWREHISGEVEDDEETNEVIFVEFLSIATLLQHFNRNVHMHHIGMNKAIALLADPNGTNHQLDSLRGG